MAKWGEGDPRWIVEERAVAHNVNNWHWRESDATHWSIKNFEELLVGLKVEDENVGSCTSSSVTCEREASVSNRKNKSFYEWNIKAKWKGRVKGDDTYYHGEVVAENMSEAYDPDKVDVEIKINKESKESPELKFLTKALGVALVREKLQTYLDCLQKEYASQPILPPKDAKPEPKIIPTSMNSIKKEIKNLVATDKKTEDTKKTGLKITTKKLKMSETFMTTVDELNLTLTQKDRVSAWPRSELKCDADVGESMSLFDKNVELEFTNLIKSKRIGMKWRMKSWLDGHYSPRNNEFTANSRWRQTHTRAVRNS